MNRSGDLNFVFVIVSVFKISEAADWERPRVKRPVDCCRLLCLQATSARLRSSADDGAVLMTAEEREPGIGNASFCW